MAIEEAIILAGGLGTRLRSVIADMPKPMAPIGGKPFLKIHLDYLKDQGIKRVILSVGYKAEIIQNAFKQAYRGMQIDYAVEKEKLDTGGAVRLALSMIEKSGACVVNGDSFVPYDLSLGSTHFEANHAPILYGYQLDDTSRYGRIDHANGMITAFREKGLAGPGIINAGVYVLPANLLDAFPLHQPFSLERDYFYNKTTSNHFHLIIAEGCFIDIGVPEDYQRAQTELMAYVH